MYIGVSVLTPPLTLYILVCVCAPVLWFLIYMFSFSFSIVVWVPLYVSYILDHFGITKDTVPTIGLGCILFNRVKICKNKFSPQPKRFFHIHITHPDSIIYLSQWTKTLAIRSIRSDFDFRFLDSGFLGFRVYYFGKFEETPALRKDLSMKDMWDQHGETSWNVRVAANSF